MRSYFDGKNYRKIDSALPDAHSYLETYTFIYWHASP